VNVVRLCAPFGGCPYLGVAELFAPLASDASKSIGLLEQ